MFHANLLHIHILNDIKNSLADQCNRSVQQISSLGGSTGKFLVKSIRAHVKKGWNAWLEVQWELGDLTWLDYE